MKKTFHQYFFLTLLLSSSINAADDVKKFTGKYFVVLNVASEMLRLYERICDESCYNKMILETEIVFGEDNNLPMGGSGKGRSILGSYRLTGWTKFYEDSARHYPSWYNESYPPLPPPNIRQPLLWFSEKYMPLNPDGTKVGKMRGAFGWYTAFIAPEAFGQWVHGTMGWGEDKEFYIVNTKKILPNIVFDLRSSGCIRNNNEAIAFLRELLVAGTPFIKIYAVERIFDPTNPMYQKKSEDWKYILTKDKGVKSDRNAVLSYLKVTSEEMDIFWNLKRSSSTTILDPSDPLNKVLELGTYTYDTHPDAIKFVPGERISRIGRKFNRNGNIYGVKSKDISGLYFVDTGLLYNYQHPKKILQVSGYMDEVSPPWMTKI